MTEEKVLNKEIAVQFLVDEYSVKLKEFTKLEDDAAKVLSKCESDLNLSGLKELSDSSATFLESFAQKIDLSGLSELSESAIVSFARSARKNTPYDIKLDANLSDKVDALRVLDEEIVWAVFNKEEIDTNNFVSITDEAAHAILENDKKGNDGVPWRTTWFDGALSESGNFQLNGLKSISLKTAECLGQLRAGSAEGISLNGLESLTDQSAEEILKYQGYFQIKGLKEISDDGLIAISNHAQSRIHSELDLPSLTKISDAAAEGISKKLESLSLSGLTRITNATAESLSKQQGKLTLSGLKELSDATAERLSDYRGGYLDLSGLSEISESALKSLSKLQGSLDLSGLSKLTDSAFDNLSQHDGELHLGGLSELSDENAKKLSLHEKSVHLSKELVAKVASFKILTVEIAEKFLSSPDYNLNSYGKIDDKAAEMLSGSSGNLVLNGLSEISDVAAEHLSKHQGYSLSLGGLRSLSDAALESFCLRELSGKKLHLPFEILENKTSLQARLTALKKAKIDDLIAKSENILTKELVQYFDSGVIESLDNFVAVEDDAIEIIIRNVRRFFGNIRLKGLKFISEKVAKAFGGLDQGSLDFPSISELSDEAAEGLSFFGGSSLNLDGLQKISANAAKSLSGYEGELSLNGLSDINLEVAENLSSGFLKKLSLNGIMQVSDEALDALKSFDETLCMDGLNEK